MEDVRAKRRLNVERNVTDCNQVNQLPDEQLRSSGRQVWLGSLLEVVEVELLWVLAFQPKMIRDFISDDS